MLDCTYARRESKVDWCVRCALPPISFMVVIGIRTRVERVKTRVVDQAVGTGRTRQVEWWQVVWWMITQKAGGEKNG